MRIDAHQHFWNYNDKEYSWINEKMIRIRKDFLPGQLHRELILSGFEGSIAVQARQSLEETRWLLQLAELHGFIKGVVGWINLRSPAITENLFELAQNKYLVGIRHVVQDEPDDMFMLQNDFLRGISCLNEFNLTYDFLLYPKHLPIAHEVALQFPDQKFVIDHLAKPDIKNGLIAPWTKGIRKIASLSNVHCKISGMVTEANWHSWRPEDFYPYLDVVFEAFGHERLMIGSDWPVCLLAADYDVVMNIVMRYIEQYDPTAKEVILGDNCARLYLNQWT